MAQKFEIQLQPEDAKAFRAALYQKSMADAVDLLGSYRWWWVDGKNMILDTQEGQLWMGGISANDSYLAGAKKYAAELKPSGLLGWRLPTKAELERAATASDFPLRSGQEYRLKGLRYFMVASGSIDVDKGYWDIDSGMGRVLACNPLFIQNDKAQMVTECAQRGWSLTPCHASLAADRKDALSTGLNVIAAYTKNQPMGFNLEQISGFFADVDYRSVRLPRLSALQFTDAHLGLWEFYAPAGMPSQSVSVSQPLRARNPELDVRDGVVAIDFGTSSTVVALRDQGRAELLRIGLQDFYKAPEPQHYENPTVLEMVDLQVFLHSWQERAYRPAVDWDTVRCSHEARASLRDNDTNPKVVGSVMERLKQWALRGQSHAAVRITDRLHGREHELAPLTERNPVKGQPLEVNAGYAFDPIELYAWFLGMTINWRSRGIFLTYNMTFPVKYNAATKRKILASFRRGLQRSLPLALTYSPRFPEFQVEEVASEPAAFAASALPAYDIEPTEDGVAYAVFDFGGGTTDFDYGFYRLPTEAEAAEGYEHVLEHFNAEGDEFLGGENLLENLVYRVFLNNLDQCRSKGIAFTRPIDAADFPGSEQLVVRTQAAITNTTMLMSKLRPFWETGQSNKQNVLKIRLLNREGVQVECDLKLDESKLQDYLHERIRQGLNNFFAAMKQAFCQQSRSLPEEIHVLLAGNASHSRIVQGFFGLLRTEEDDDAKSLHDIALADLAQIFGAQVPELEIHPPLRSDPNDLYKPNTKTGVALGILELGKGGTLKVINHALHSDESPFQYYVGGFELKKFKVKITRGTPYGGDWVALGRVRDQVFDLPYTQAANSTSNELRRGDLQLREKRVTLPAAQNGDWVFARPAAPEKLELCTAATLEAASAGQGQHLQTLELAVQR